MYCPRCAQQPLPDDVRFCTRCGFQLAAVSQSLRTEGIIYIQPKERLPLIKRPELRKGAKLIFFSFFSLVPSFILAGIIDPLRIPLAVPIIIAIPFITFLAGLVQIFYYFFFGESLLPIKTQDQSFAFNENPRQLNYQPGQSFPFETRSFDTTEFVQPPSITEPTTDLIKSK
jgi:hypothetical protein